MKVPCDRLTMGDKSTLQIPAAEFLERQKSTVQYKLNAEKKAGTYNTSHLWHIIDKSDMIFSGICAANRKEHWLKLQIMCLKRSCPAETEVYNMYLATKTIVDSIERLGSVNPFYGITYLACKEGCLPVGESKEVSLDSLTKRFMDKVHKLHPASKMYFQPYESNTRSKRWVVPRYPSTSLQITNTRGFFAAFIHSKINRTWGWDGNYINILAEKLEGEPLSALDLGVWFFRNNNWSEDTSHQDIIEEFFAYFHITPDEQRKLFLPIESSLVSKLDFQETATTWNRLSFYLPSPSDVAPERGSTLSYLEINNVGPASQLIIEPNKHLNLIAGDNGLGKTFLMECIWWAMTGTWPGLPAYPKSAKYNASIIYGLSGMEGGQNRNKIIYDMVQRKWSREIEAAIKPGLIVYARIDDSFAVWDPVKQHQDTVSSLKYVFSNNEIWYGASGSIEGLIRDWVKWQNTTKHSPWNIFKAVLEKMSPPDLGMLIPGEPVRMLGDIVDTPTITHTYGSTPIIHAAAGIKRIITLAYLIVWAWHEHKIAAESYNVMPERRMIILLDEIEEHLHPKWQRIILPALLNVQSLLSHKLEIQYIISTHSPLILASSETLFDKRKDSLFHLEIEKDTREISLSKLDFIKHGSINAWLTSQIFGLDQPRALKVEETINLARDLQLQDNPDIKQIANVHQKLLNELSADDPFWPRWIYFVEKNGVGI
ncbi:MAG: ATP-binding protein [Spirochaetaceae bacterium]|nr:ATP-binding protein [Spirochaetaceae bacterium]